MHVSCAQDTRLKVRIMEEGDPAQRHEPARKAGGVLGVLPLEWQEAHRNQIMPTLKALAKISKLKNGLASTELQVSIVQRKQAELLAQIEGDRGDLQAPSTATGARTQRGGKQSSAQAALEKRNSQLQAKISKLYDKAYAMKAEVGEAERSAMKMMGFNLKGHAGPELPRKHAHPASSPFVDLLLANPDLFSVLLSFLSSDDSGAVSLARCSRGTKSQVAGRLTHLAISQAQGGAPLALFCARLPMLISIDLTGCRAPSHQLALDSLVNCNMPPRLQELRVEAWPASLCNVRWPRLHTLHAQRFDLNPNHAAMKALNPLPVLSTLYTGHGSDNLRSLVRGLEAGLLPRLTRVVCTPQRRFCPAYYAPLVWSPTPDPTAPLRLFNATATPGMVDLLARLLELAPQSDALQVLVEGARVGPVLAASCSAYDAFQNLRHLSLRCLSHTLAILLPAVASGIPLLENLFLVSYECHPPNKVARNERDIVLELPVCCWPNLHTLGFAMSETVEPLARVILESAGPRLRVLDLSGDLGAPGDLEAAQRVYDVLAVLQALDAAEEVAWRASLHTLVLPPCGNPRITHTAQVFCSTLASVLSRLPGLQTLTAPTVDTATTIAFIAARAGGALRRLHTLRFTDAFKDATQVLLLLRLMCKEEDGGSRAFTVYADEVGPFGDTLRELVRHSGHCSRLPKLA